MGKRAGARAFPIDGPTQSNNGRRSQALRTVWPGFGTGMMCLQLLNDLIAGLRPSSYREENMQPRGMSGGAEDMTTPVTAKAKRSG